MYVPPDPKLKKELLRQYHDAPTAGHMGAKRTLKLLQRHYYWEVMAREVKSYVGTCAECQRAKARRHRPHGLLASLPVPGGPWKEISMDFIVDLPKSRDANGKVCDSMLVVVDRLTKVSIYIPTRKKLTSSELADFYMHYVFKRFGLPEGIVIDRGTIFISKFWGTFCYRLAMARRLSTAFYPQIDGQTERQNQNVENFLRIFCNYHQSDWALLTTFAEYAYNNSYHETIRSTPFRAMMGYDPRGPGDLGLEPVRATKERSVAASERAERLSREREELREIIAEA